MDSKSAQFIQELIGYFSNLDPKGLENLDRFYSNNAEFKDPFNHTFGLSNIRRIFDHMFESLHEPRFIVTNAVWDKDKACLCWDFVFAPSSKPKLLMTAKGCSYLNFTQDEGGALKILVHRDYWDPAEEIYEKLPLLGVLFRWLKRLLSTPGLKS
jgi:hypothetical protein